MTSTPGIKAIMFCEKGTIYRTPINPFYVGARLDGCEFVIEDVETIKDAQKRELRNKIGYNLKVKSLQCRLKELEIIHNYVKNNYCDVQIVTSLEPGAMGNNKEGIFTFSGSNAFGIEYEFNRSLKSNYIGIEAGRYYDYKQGKLLLAAASTNTINEELNNTRGRQGLDFIKIVKPNITQILLNNKVLAEVAELDEFDLNLKTNGNKTLMGVVFGNTIESNVKIKGYCANIDDVYAKYEENEILDLKVIVPVQYRNEDTQQIEEATETYVFKDFTSVNKLSINDEKRILELNYKAEIPIKDMVFAFEDDYKKQYVILN